MFNALTVTGIVKSHDIELKNQNVRWACTAANLDVQTSLDGWVETAFSGSCPEFVDLWVLTKQPGPEGREAHGVTQLGTRVTGAIFAIFAERVREWVERNHGTDYLKWPPVSNFARVVRNAIVHGGTINIKNEKAPTVEWRGRRYNHLNFGQQIMHSANGVSAGDLLLLMADLEDELNELGAPFEID